MTAADATFNAAHAELQHQDEEFRRKIQNKHAMTVQEVVKKHDQGVWLADSLLENEQNGAAVDFKKAKETVEAHRKALDDLEAQAAVLLETYKTRISEPSDAEKENDKAETIPPAQAEAAYHAQLGVAETQLIRLADLRLPKLFVGATPFLALTVLCVLAAVATQAALQKHEPQWKELGIAVGSTLVASIGFGLLLRHIAKRRVADTYIPFRAAVATARCAATGEMAFATANREQRLHLAKRHRKAEIQALKEKYEPFIHEAGRKRDAALELLRTDFDRRSGELKGVRR